MLTMTIQELAYWSDSVAVADVNKSIGIKLVRITLMILLQHSFKVCCE